MEESPKKHSLSTIIITALAVIIILVLAFLFYYYSIKAVPSVPQTSAPTANNTNIAVVPAQQIIPTNVIPFTPPEVLPTVQKNGSCWVNSIASPRQDAWRCMVGNVISDPCFEMKQSGFVFCQMNPSQPDFFVIKLTKDLPKASAPITVQDNWAWFLTLKDGTICSPFTGTRPFFNENQVAYYGCKSNNKDEQSVLLGDLTKDIVWKANKAILTKTGGVTSGSWTIQSTEQVEVDIVWQ